jgi:hypothetical protein
MKVRDENGWELVSHDERMGRTVWSYYDGQATHYRTDYRVDNIVNDNKVAQAELAGKRWGDGQRIASIPLNVYFDQLEQAHKEGDDKYVSRWLNDGDNAAFRVKEGRV